MLDQQQISEMRASEFEITARVLKAYPEAKLDMKPAEKSRTPRELITTLINEEYMCKAALLDKKPEFPKNFPGTISGLLEVFTKSHNEVQSLIEKNGNAALDRTVDFFGYKMKAIDVIHDLLLDQIHHRGQFSVYLRLAGAKVPSIYGPSADEPMPSADSNKL